MNRPHVQWTFHGTAAVADYHQALSWLSRFVGTIEMQPATDLPAPVARIGGCCWLGDNMVELAQPNSAQSPVARFIDRFGTGPINLALQVSDLATTAAWLAAQGAPVTPEVEHGFTFTRAADAVGLQFEWSDLDAGAIPWDPRVSGQLGPDLRTGLIHAPRVAQWGALVHDVDAALARFAQLWQPPVLFRDEDADPGEVAAAVALPDGVLTLYRTSADAEEGMRLWGIDAARPRFHLIGLRVADLDGAEAVLRAEGVRIVRRTTTTPGFVTHPEDTAGLLFSWTDEELPGDPRGRWSDSASEDGPDGPR